MSEPGAAQAVPRVEDELTAHAVAGEEQRAKEVGCDAYLSKPVEPKRVLEEVRRFIGPGTR